MNESWKRNNFDDRRKNLTTTEQLAILEKLKEGVSYAVLARKYGRTMKTIKRIEQLEDEIRYRHFNGRMKRSSPVIKAGIRRVGSNDTTLTRVEQVLEAWIRKSHAEGNPLTSVEIRDKAKGLFETYKPQKTDVEFKASKSWLYRFKRRQNLDLLALGGYREDGSPIIEIDDDFDEDDGEIGEIYNGHFIDGNNGPSTSASSDVHRPPYEPVYITDDEEETFLEGDEVDYENATDAEKSHHETALPEFVNSAPDVDNLPIEQPASFKNETLSPSKPKHYPTVGECDLFGEYVSKHLQQLPLDVALKLQCGIQNLVMKTRLEYARQNPNEVPPIVKKEIRDDPEEEQTNPNENTQEPQTGKRHLDDEPPEAKRRKPEAQTNDKKPTTSQSPKPQRTKSKRTDCVVFAEQIAVQLEQLPEDLALRLQSDIYAMITQASPEFINGHDPLEEVKIKSEAVEVSPTEIF